jgi:hypothetical protein
MPGYASALGADLKSFWSEFLPTIDMFFDSPYFWPGVMASIVIIFLGARLLIK